MSNSKNLSISNYPDFSGHLSAPVSNLEDLQLSRSLQLEWYGNLLIMEDSRCPEKYLPVDTAR